MKDPKRLGLRRMNPDLQSLKLNATKRFDRSKVATFVPAKSTPLEAQRIYGQTRAKDQFLELCRDVCESGQRIYVRDKAGISYLTLAPTSKDEQPPPIAVPAQRFKSHFSRFSYLVKDGATFKVQLRNDQFVFARRHTKYRDPLQDIIDQWIGQLKRLPVEDDDEDQDA